MNGTPLEVHKIENGKVAPSILGSSIWWKIANFAERTFDYTDYRIPWTGRSKSSREVALLITRARCVYNKRGHWFPISSAKLQIGFYCRVKNRENIYILPSCCLIIIITASKYPNYDHTLTYTRGEYKVGFLFFFAKLTFWI